MNAVINNPFPPRWGSPLTSKIVWRYIDRENNKVVSTFGHSIGGNGLRTDSLLRVNANQNIKG